MNRHIEFSPHSILGQASWNRLSGLGASLVAALKDRYERLDERRALMTLDDRMLRDIGLSRADVEREYLKSSWRP